jgi:Ser/Thr protein kinase RdoA (MazF antagonist)
VARTTSELLAASGLFETTAPVETESVLGALRERYGFEGELEAIATEKDNTFRLRGGAQDFLVKVARPDEPLAVSLCQTEATDWVLKTDPSIPAQAVRRTSDGASYVPLTDRTGAFQGFMRMLDFIPGRLLASEDPSPAQLRQVGAMLGRVDLALAGFDHEELERPLVWNLDHFLEFESLLEFEPDPHRRRMAAEIFELFRTHLEPVRTGLRRQAIHGDFSAFNAVVDPATVDYVTGVIDFGDVNRGPVIFDPAVLLAGAQLLAGYLAIHPLNEEEVGLVTTTALARLALRPVVTNLRLQHVPERAAYLREHSGHDWARIENALAFGHDQARDYLLTTSTK